MSRANPCVFIGYPFRQKAYKVLNLVTHKIHVSRDIKFFEYIFPLHAIQSKIIPPIHPTCCYIPVSQNYSGSHHPTFSPPSQPSNSQDTQNSPILLMPLRRSSRIILNYIIWKSMCVMLHLIMPLFSHILLQIFALVLHTIRFLVIWFTLLMHLVWDTLIVNQLYIIKLRAHLISNKQHKLN